MQNWHFSIRYDSTLQSAQKRGDFRIVRFSVYVDESATGESRPPDSIAPFPWRNPEDTTVTEILGIEGLPTQIGLVSVSIHFSLPI